MGRSELLARVNFPLFTIQCLSDRFILVAGGGGGSKTGIRNAIEIYELINNGSTCRAEPVTHYETGKEAIMNSAVLNAGKYFILFAGQEGNCQVYKIKQEIQTEAREMDKTQKDGDSSSSSLRNRTNLCSGVTKCENTHTASVNAPSNSNATVYNSKLQFKIKPLECFQTDFSEEPFQKLARFSKAENFLATGGADGHIRVWQHPKLNQIFDIKAHQDDVDDIDVCPMGKRIVSVSRDGHGRVYNSTNGSLITELQSGVPAKSDVRYIFRSCRFGVVDDKKDLALFTILNPAVRRKPPMKSFLCKYETKQFCLEKSTSTGTDTLSCMAISDDGRFIGLGTQSGGVKLYIAFSLQLVYKVNNIHSIFVTCVQFLPTSDESRRITGGHETSLVSVSVDNRVIIHHMPMRASMQILTLLTLFILTLFLIFVIMDFLNL